MSLTQVDKDFLQIKTKLYSENEAFLNKLKNNNEYSLYKKKISSSLFLPILLTLLGCLVLGGIVFVLNYFFPTYFVTVFICGIVLVLLLLAILLYKCATRLNQIKAINKKGYFNACFTVEKCFDRLCFYISSINLETASKNEKKDFYKNLSHIFDSCATTLGGTYKEKSKKLVKLTKITSDWQWVLKYLYNFGKFCLNKKKDALAFSNLFNN